MDKEHPTKRDFNLFKNIPHSLPTLFYFFERCNNPAWLEYLKKVTKSHPLLFPEAHYLARMAEHRPELVRDIIMQMPETDNVQVLSELAEAALKMPPEISATLIEKFNKWTDVQYLDVVLAEKLGDLIEHLAKGNQLEQALSLAENLLDVKEPGEDVFKKFGLDTKIQDPQTKIGDIWHYKEIFSKNVPVLIKAGKSKAFSFLCKLLNKAIRISIELESENEDFSFIWRPAIEEHPQNIKEDVKNVLVDAVRDAAELFIKENLASLEGIIAHFESYPYPIFRRIFLYLLWRFTEQAQELISKYLTDYHFFSDPHFRHEYTLLLRKAFHTISAEEQKQIFKWIENGPEPELLEGKSSEERESYKKWWLYRELARFNLEDLPKEWQKQYKELVKEFGEPEHPAAVVKRIVSGILNETFVSIHKNNVLPLVKAFSNFYPSYFHIPHKYSPLLSSHSENIHHSSFLLPPIYYENSLLCS